MTSTHRQIEKLKDFEVTRQLSVGVKRWIESSPDPVTKTIRTGLYNESARFL